MSHTELNNEQRRELINMQQMFEAWRAADHEFRHSYKGRMRWKKVHGQEYLYRVHGKTEKSLGPVDGLSSVEAKWIPKSVFR